MNITTGQLQDLEDLIQYQKVALQSSDMQVVIAALNKSVDDLVALVGQIRRAPAAVITPANFGYSRPAPKPEPKKKKGY